MVLAEADPATGEPRPGARESELRLAPGSLYVLADESRYDYAHAIAPEGRRLSLILRDAPADFEQRAGVSAACACARRSWQPAEASVMRDTSASAVQASLRAAPTAAEGPRHAVPCNNDSPTRCRSDCVSADRLHDRRAELREQADRVPERHGGLARQRQQRHPLYGCDSVGHRRGNPEARVGQREQLEQDAQEDHRREDRERRRVNRGE